MSLTTRIFLAMFLGVLCGTLANVMLPQEGGGAIAQWLREGLFYNLFEVVGKVFIASLKVLVVPLVLVSLVCGTASLGGHGRMGPMAIKTIALYLSVSYTHLTLPTILPV